MQPGTCFLNIYALTGREGRRECGFILRVLVLFHIILNMSWAVWIVAFQQIYCVHALWYYSLLSHSIELMSLPFYIQQYIYIYIYVCVCARLGWKEVICCLLNFWRIVCVHGILVFMTSNAEVCKIGNGNRINN